eukprot:1384327-Amorphochlora_amoeboformis.AAC.2
MAGRRCTPRRSLSVDATTSSNDFKNGMNLEVDGYWVYLRSRDRISQVTEFLHVKPGKGSAFVRTKLKNLLSGNSVEKTFRAGETVSWVKGYGSRVMLTGASFTGVGLPTTVRGITVIGVT